MSTTAVSRTNYSDKFKLLFKFILHHATAKQFRQCFILHTTSSKSPKTTGICKIFILKFMDITNNHSGLPYSTVDKTTKRLELFELKLPEKTAQKVLIPSVSLKRCMFGYKQTTCSSRMGNPFGTFKQARKLCSISISTAKGWGESCYSCPSLVLYKKIRKTYREKKI